MGTHSGVPDFAAVLDKGICPDKHTCYRLPTQRISLQKQCFMGLSSWNAKVKLKLNPNLIIGFKLPREEIFKKRL